MLFKVPLVAIALLLLFSTPSWSGEKVQYEFIESSRSILRAGPGQSLSMLVQEMYPGHKKLWPQIEQEIRRRNPQAFNQYSGKIIPGRRIKLITVKVIRDSYIVHQKVVGQVEEIKGTVEATDTRGSTRTLQAKSEVYEGDRISSGPKGTVRIVMVDEAEFHLKVDSSVRLTEYRLKSGFDKGSKSIIDLIKGGLRTLTGAIAANPLAVYRFQTGVMTIGVRGTDYVVKLCQINDCIHSSGRNDSQASLHVAVLDGLITLQDEEGVVGEMIMGQYAIVNQSEKVMVDDARPVAGLLNAQEQRIFEKLQTSPEQKDSLTWPWLLGGALLGL